MRHTAAGLGLTVFVYVLAFAPSFSIAAGPPAQPKPDPIDNLAPVHDDAIGSAPTSLPATAIPMQMRVADFVLRLKQESSQESIANLSDARMFYSPGIPDRGGRGMIPTHDLDELQVLDRICSNRRFVKILQDLSKLSKREASDLVAAQIDISLPLYKSMYDKTYTDLVAARSDPTTRPTTSGLTFQTANNPDGTPSLLGLRLQILGLLLVAGDLDLADAFPSIERAAAVALKQRSTIYETSAIARIDRLVLLREASLYNRSILATAAVGPRQRPNTERVLRKLNGFDATVTPYDKNTMWLAPDLKTEATAWVIQATDSVIDSLFKPG